MMKQTQLILNNAPIIKGKINLILEYGKDHYKQYIYGKQLFTEGTP